MDERGVDVNYTTLHRWIQLMLLNLKNESSVIFKTLGCSWRVDETYIKGKAQGNIYIVLLAKKEKRSILCFVIKKQRIYLLLSILWTEDYFQFIPVKNIKQTL